MTNYWLIGLHIAIFWWSGLSKFFFDLVAWIASPRFAVHLMYVKGTMLMVCCSSHARQSDNFDGLPFISCTSNLQFVKQDWKFKQDWRFAVHLMYGKLTILKVCSSSHVQQTDNLSSKTEGWPFLCSKMMSMTQETRNLGRKLFRRMSVPARAKQDFQMNLRKSTITTSNNTKISCQPFGKFRLL
jgi:hypothetical protein